jgi:leucyl-tRNA synthetase
MELCNELHSFNDSSDLGMTVYRETLEGIILMLAPILPHACHAMWQRLGNQQAVYQAPWPSVDQKALKKDNVEIVVQVNGKKRATINVSVTEEKSQIEAAAVEEENVQKFIDAKEIVKVIVVPGRLVNIVVK